MRQPLNCQGSPMDARDVLLQAQSRQKNASLRSTKTTFSMFTN